MSEENDNTFLPAYNDHLEASDPRCYIFSAAIHKSLEELGKGMADTLASKMDGLSTSLAAELSKVSSTLVTLLGKAPIQPTGDDSTGTLGGKRVATSPHGGARGGGVSLHLPLMGRSPILGTPSAIATQRMMLVKITMTLSAFTQGMMTCKDFYKDFHPAPLPQMANSPHLWMQT